LLDTIAPVAATVATHSAGTAALTWCLSATSPGQIGALGICGLVIAVILALVVYHLVELTWWSLFYGAHGCFPDQPTAL
jgi:hypothetical protein